MFVSVQFPVADLRRFVAGRTGHLPLPTWPSPLPSLEFIRGFGPISRRPRVISQDYLGEHRVCEAHRALRFVPVERPEFECAYRRFFFDGKLIGKFDIGLRRKRVPLSLDVPATKLGDALQRALELGFCVPGLAGGEKPRPLHSVSGLLAKAYLRASTARHVSTLTSWALGGRPMVVVECGPFDRLLPPSHAQSIPCTLGPGVSLHHFGFEPKAGTQLSCWLLYSASELAEPSIRYLRICLAQLHATRECLELVLHSIVAGKIAPTADSEARQALQEYFDATRHQLSRMRARSKGLGVGFTDAAEAAFEQINPFTEQLLETLEKALKQLGLKYSTVKGALREVGSGDPRHRTVSTPSGLDQLGEPIALSSPKPAESEDPLLQADIVIVTALKEERDAVLSYQEGLHEPWRSIRGPKGFNYHAATFELLQESSRKLRVVVARPLQMGSVHTVSLAIRLTDLRPSLLAMSGICAGDRRLKQRQLLEPEGLKLSETGLRWVENFMVEHPDGEPEEARFPTVHVSPMATTAYVQQDPELFPSIERLVRKTLGVEMEGAAIGVAAQNEELPMLVIKAVSDHGDHEKDDRFRRYAAEASAWFLLDFLRKHWTDIIPEEEASMPG